jgi:hypothetical protein
MSGRIQLIDATVWLIVPYGRSLAISSQDAAKRSGVTQLAQASMAQR